MTTAGQPLAATGGQPRAYVVRTFVRYSQVMRFAARDAGDGSWGVWDSALNAYRRVGLSATDAAAEVDRWILAYDVHGRRRGEVTHLHPPVPVRVAEPAAPVWAGVLDVWVRDPGGWYGRVSTPDQQTRWVAAEHVHRHPT